MKWIKFLGFVLLEIIGIAAVSLIMMPTSISI